MLLTNQKAPHRSGDLLPDAPHLLLLLDIGSNQFNVCEYSLTLKSIGWRKVSVNWTFGQDRAIIFGKGIGPCRDLAWGTGNQVIPPEM